ncbi:MAG: hypothetical protein OXU92_09515 [Deltaproteobacteria bacterium]|nr:hypothetical protein [Deltaproteobacteria bacterium]
MRAFALLTLAALRAAARSFGIWAVALLCVLALLFLETCAGCSGAGTLVLNGEALLLGGALSELTALVMALSVAAMLVWLAGMLAVDPLRRSLRDGSAALALARPVSRSAFALAQLAGVLTVAWSAAALLLGASAWLLGGRLGLDLAPLPGLGLACALGCVVTAALALAASTRLPRFVTTLGVSLLLLPLDLLFAMGALPPGAATWLARLWPPLVSSLLAPLLHWLPGWLPGGLLPFGAGALLELDPAVLLLRLACWALLALVLLVLSLQTLELGR